VTEPSQDFTGLRALFIKCTLKRSPELSNTQGLGDNSSVMKNVHERLHGGSHLLNDAGQYLYYGRVGGVSAYRNIRSGWDAGCRYDFANPEYR
jgi:hypothetical protein